MTSCDVCHVAFNHTFEIDRQCCMIQVYLLTPMDRSTLPHAKSPIPHFTPSEITRQQNCKRYLKHIAKQIIHHLSVISTYIDGKAQTPLGRFVVDVLYKQVCNKYTINRTDGA